MVADGHALTISNLEFSRFDLKDISVLWERPRDAFKRFASFCNNSWLAYDFCILAFERFVVIPLCEYT